MAVLPVYAPSGRLGPAGPLLFTAVGIPAALLIGWAYANALHAVTWKPASILVAMVFWVALALVAVGLAQQSRSRSPAFNRWAATAIAFVALWAHWVVVLKIDSGSAAASQFLQSGPVGWAKLIGDLASERSEGRFFSFWSWCALWALEAAITVAMPASMTKDAAQQPFSESAKVWAKPSFKGELVAPGASSAALAGTLRANGAAALLRYPSATSLAGGSLASEWWTIEVEGLAVESDPSARWLNVIALRQKRGDSGRVKVTKEPVVAAWHVTADEFEAVRHQVNPADAPAGADAGAAGVIGEPPVTAPELQPALDAFEQGRFAAAFELASASAGSAQPQIRADAHRLCAQAASRLGDWPTAFDHYETLFETEPTAFNALQLASTSVCVGNLSRGRGWLAKAHDINGKTSEMQPPRIDTGYLSALSQSGEFAATLPLLDKLAASYSALPTLDDHLVWSHGLPFFGEFLRLSSPLLQQALGPAGVAVWYERLRNGLCADGIDRLDEFLRSPGQNMADLRH